MRFSGHIVTGLLVLGVLPAVACADAVEDIIGQITLEEYKGYLRLMTGVEPLPVSPPNVMTNRYSFYYEIHSAAQWLQDQWEAVGLEVTKHTFDPQYGPNVIAELPGTTRPDEIYIICGHFDTYHAANQFEAPGCDDNASGSCTALLAGRLLAEHRFEGTIRIIAFAGEEQWMVGSQAYANAARQAGENIVAVINLDMILHPGFDNQNPDPDYDLDLQANAASLPLGQYLADQFATYTTIDYEVHTNPQFVSDHWSFWQAGYAAVGLAENTAFEIWGGSNNAYHSLQDTIDNPTYDWDFALQTVKGSIAALINLAGLLPRGDLNCNGMVDFGDINPFVLALSDPVGYGQAFPVCTIMNGDINADGKVDFGDINPFVDLLTQP